MAALCSSTTKHSRFRSQPLTRPKPTLLERDRRQRRQRECVRLVQGQMGIVLADYADRPDESVHRSRYRCRQARVRCDDADEKDRHRCNRGGAPRLRLQSSKRACPSIEVVPRPRGLRHNPALERPAAAVYFTCDRASRVRHHGRSTALRSAARGFRSIMECVPAFRQAVTPRRQQWQVRGVSW